MGRLKIGANDSVRKNIVISKAMYEQTLKIANEIGLTYPEYIRKVLLSEIKRTLEPPKIPLINESDFDFDIIKTNYIGFKKRKEILSIMRMMRRLLWEED